MFTFETDCVLNPALLHSIATRIGPVRVLARGEPLSGYYEDNPVNRRKKLRVLSRGETYVTSCPFCGDTRGRMSINHRYGVYDPETGFYGRELWKCYNEECQSDPEKRKELRTRLSGLDWKGPELKTPDIRISAVKELEPIEFPGVLVPVSDLPDDHAAKQYLVSRNFDPVDLYKTWRISYGEYVQPRQRGAMSQDRIIVPVRRNGVMVGWQARYPGELDWKATGIQKYLTYFQKSLTLYGIDEQAGTPYVAVFEGVTDVWRHGPGGVCLLGKTASTTQVKLLHEAAGTRPIVFVPDYDDPDSEPAMFKIASDLVNNGHGGPVTVAPLPAGIDPADLPESVLRKVVSEAAAEVSS